MVISSNDTESFWKHYLASADVRFLGELDAYEQFQKCLHQ